MVIPIDEYCQKWLGRTYLHSLMRMEGEQLFVTAITPMAKMIYKVTGFMFIRRRLSSKTVTVDAVFQLNGEEPFNIIWAEANQMALDEITPEWVDEIMNQRITRIPVKGIMNLIKMEIELKAH